MTPQRPIAGSAMSAPWDWMPRVAMLTALTLLLSGFVFPPVQSPGVSISKANAADSETAAAELTGRDAEEDGAGENELEDLAVADPTAAISAPFLTACRGGRPREHAAWPTAGRQHGTDSVRGPPV